MFKTTDDRADQIGMNCLGSGKKEFSYLVLASFVTVLLDVAFGTPTVKYADGKFDI